MKRLPSVLRHDLVHNTLALYGVQVCRKLLPLIAIPYLARVLRPEGWGTVAFVSSLGEFIVLTVEFGFNLSATREIAQNRESAERCGLIASGVVGSQVLLASLACAVVLIFRRSIPVLNDHYSLLWAGLLYGVFQGLNPIWFFQGLENIRLAAAIEAVGKVLALGGLFVFVRNPSDEWQVLALQALPAMISTAAGFLLALKRVKLYWPTPALVAATLRKSWPLFLFRSAESLYGVGNAFILGLFAAPVAVGYFAMAERISRAVFGLMDPVREAVFPRLSSLAGQSKAKAARLARIGSGLMIAGGIILGILIYALAPLMIRFAGAASFEPAVRVLRIFSILPPLLSITHSVGIQWLLSTGRERVVNIIMLSAGVLNVCLAFVVAPRFQYIGMAWNVVVVETLVCITMFYVVRRISPFWIREIGPTFPNASPEPLASRLP